MTQHHHELMKAYQKAGGMPDVLRNQNFAHLMIHGNEVYSSHLIKGLTLEAERTPCGVDINFRMLAGYQFEQPVQLCFGVIPEEGEQEINVNGTLEEDSKVHFVAYCVFPNAISVKHRMQGEINIGSNARFNYTEIHHHGNNGGIIVQPKVNVLVGPHAHYSSQFYLTRGRAGIVELDYMVRAQEGSVVDLLAKVNAIETDIVRVKEKVILEGENARGVIQSRMVGRGRSDTEVISEIVALAQGTIGHVDCIETLLDQAVARAVPLVDVRNSKAVVTHEAAIGSINSKQLQTIMAKGLTEDEAIEVLVRGMLR